jgi:hypothetical protein
MGPERAAFNGGGLVMTRPEGLVNLLKDILLAGSVDDMRNPL